MLLIIIDIEANDDEFDGLDSVGVCWGGNAVQMKL